MKKIFSVAFLMFCVISLVFSQNDNQEQRDPNAPKNTVKIPGREIYVNKVDEVTRMPWDVAKSACACLGSGWRLPTIVELQTMYGYKELIGNFKKGYYWAYDQKINSDKYYNLNFKNGKIDDEDIDENNRVRCVWSPIKSE